MDTTMNRNTIWLVVYERWDESYVDSVWSSEKKAETWVEGKYGGSEYYHIEEWDIDEYVGELFK